MKGKAFSRASSILYVVLVDSEKFELLKVRGVDGGLLRVK